MTAPLVARRLDNPRGPKCWGVFRNNLPVAMGLTEADARLFAAAPAMKRALDDSADVLRVASKLVNAGRAA